MHLVTAQAAPAFLPTLPDGCKLIGKTPHVDNGVTWQVFENRKIFLFGFATSTGFIGGAEFETMPRAEKAAKRWCAAFVHDPVFEPAPALEVVGAEAFDAAVFGEPGDVDLDVEPLADSRDGLGTHEIAGWRIEVSEGRPGTFRAEVCHVQTGKAGALDQNFTGKATAREARGDAALWAMQHAVDVPRISAKIDGEVVDLEEIHGDADAQLLGEQVPGTGWRVTTVDGKRGTFNAHLLSEDGAVCPERFEGHTTRDGAAAEACEWARENPQWTSTFQVSPHVVEHELAVAAAEDARAAETELAPATADLRGAQRDVTLDEVADLRAENERLRREVAQREAAERRFVADASEAGVKAAQYRALRERREVLIYEIASRKDRLKGVDEELRILSGDGMEFLAALATGIRAMSYQQTLTFDDSTAVRVSVGAQAQQVAAAIGTQKWAFNGVEHVIESSSDSTPQGMHFVTWIRGHRETTEGFGEAYQQAVEQTQAAASVVFADGDPGEPEPAPAVRLPPKRGRKPKLAGHDLDAVKAALADGVLEAAKTLGATPQQVEKFAAKYLPEMLDAKGGAK